MHAPTKSNEIYGMKVKEKDRKGSKLLEFN
jgi:hypothetical protein